MMEKTILLLAGFMLLSGCLPPAEDNPEEKSEGMSENQSKLVALGDSLTMGIQDGGLAADFQKNNYPYLVAKQWGEAGSFEQPYIKNPGIGVPPFSQPLDWDEVEDLITWDFILEPDPEEILSQVLSSLDNADLNRPYNNLAVNGARLLDLRNTTGYGNSQAPDNFFFDIVLRNLNLPLPGLYDFSDKTMLEQAAMLEPAPKIVILWIGNNDVLNSVLSGGEESPTDETVFEEEFEAVLKKAKKISNKVVVANIPSYIPFPYAISEANPDLKVFSFEDFTPLDFGGGTTYDLLFEESGVLHLTLLGGMEYMDSGYGVPQAAADAMPELFGGKPHIDDPISAEFTLTVDEINLITAAVNNFNDIISEKTSDYGYPLVDANSLFESVRNESDSEYDEYTAKFIYLTEGKDTIFSLDGVHVSNLGHAICANAFIQVINDTWSKGIPELDPGNFTGQYANRQIRPQAASAIRRVRDFYKR